ncbi:FAD-binding monooxygenase [Pseudomonas syringae pv. syringae]|nr:FAD-binding monooxygenase [Pseudomonas syringae pv. syringae]MCF5181954.1 FAD-binding monooxygenase [Pseudomonas syringae]MCF5313933.1 FAD-binding monooxygenase [Pseudomonas syringae]MCF5363475.1 FAD-binding monooxygenase [Pseudomonas syringae]MCF5388561.1 FAD-binding monooxygenase [Pseudomonas syringae]
MILTWVRGVQLRAVCDTNHPATAFHHPTPTSTHKGTDLRYRHNHQLVHDAPHTTPSVRSHRGPLINQFKSIERSPCRVLITGASIAGCAAAWWLTQRDCDVTVVEQAPAFRDGGQNVDVRGAAREILRLMGLEQAVKDLNTGETGLAWVDEDNRTAARIDLAGLDGDGPTAELEVLRGDLARLLYEASSADAFYRFGDRIVSVEHDAEGVSVTFEGGGEERFDLLIIAEGVGSRTRELVFPGENQPRRMDLACAFFTVPRAPTDSQTARWYNAVGGRSAGVRPDNRGTTRAFFNVQGRSHLTVGNSVAEQKAFLRASFAGAGWEVPRLLEGMEAAEDFWFDDLRQVKIDRWSNGPVVLLGDAAWCVTPLGGVGASLSLIGAYVLAGELTRTDTIAEALASYEYVLRPVVKKSQSVPKLVPRLVHPRSQTGVKILRAVQRLVATPFISKRAARALTPAVQSFTLPDYR